MKESEIVMLGLLLEGDIVPVISSDGVKLKVASSVCVNVSDTSGVRVISAVCVSTRLEEIE